MTAMTVLPREGEWTIDDLRDLPDDGLQYELADGILLVSPAPRIRHQRVLGRLFRVVEDAAPAGVEVYFSPVDFQPTRTRSLQPDLLVVRVEDVRIENITAPLLLAVEVLSPSTRSKDLVLKKELYRSSGVASYWVVDPLVPSLTAWDLVDDAYVEVAVCTAPVTLQLPFPVTVDPAALATG